MFLLQKYIPTFIFLSIFSWIFCNTLLANLGIQISHSLEDGIVNEDVYIPTIIWWTPFTGLVDNLKKCTYSSCLFTEERSSFQEAKVFLFYGTDFNVFDLPLPRKVDHWWVLLHEESPKNQPIFNHQSALSLFNLTSTFKSESDMPLTLQYLQSIELLMSKKYFRSFDDKHLLISEENISPIIYLQSDCNPPSERDEYVEALSQFISIDSYGKCLNNRKLSDELEGIENINHPGLLNLVSKYKFSIAFENTACDDYITEKLWRPLLAGSIPIYWGSPSVKKWIPNPISIIHVRDFDSPKDLSDYLNYLMINQSMYTSYLDHKVFGTVSNDVLTETLEKRTWGINEDQEVMDTFVDALECFVCDTLFLYHNNTKTDSFIANQSHYECPVPEKMLTKSSLRNENNISPGGNGNKYFDDQKTFWVEQWYQSKSEAEVLFKLLNFYPNGFSSDTFYAEVMKVLRNNDYFQVFHNEDL